MAAVVAEAVASCGPEPIAPVPRMEPWSGGAAGCPLVLGMGPADRGFWVAELSRISKTPPHPHLITDDQGSHSSTWVGTCDSWHCIQGRVLAPMRR